MDYDFTEAEFAFFADIEERIKGNGSLDALECKGASGDAGHIRRLLGALADTEYLKLGVEPVEGLSGHLALMGAMEVFADISPSAYLSVEASARLFGRAVSRWAGPEQKKRYLEPVLAGNALGALALSEASMNIENDPLATTGEKHGDSVIVNGAKQYVINAPVADWIAAAGVCRGHHALFVIEKETPGLMIDPWLETMGYQGTPISGVTLDNCEIPADRVIYPEQDLNMPAAVRMWENQVLLGASLGLAKTAFDSARDYAKHHKSGGRPVIAYQEVGFKLAEMLTMMQTSRLLAYRAAWSLESEPAESDGLIMCAKVFCTESCERICSEALKILSASGYIHGSPAERAYRCAKFGQIAGTSTEIARMKIGDAALGYRN
ncbi:MAG: acyl-CoA dehydrogenase family protein [Desulfobacterales bacterium]